MKKTDRILLLFLIIGVWALIGTLWFKPNIVSADGVKNAHGVVKLDTSIAPMTFLSLNGR